LPRKVEDVSDKQDGRGPAEGEVQSLSTRPLTLTGVPGEIAIEPNCPKCTGPMVRSHVGYVGIYGWWLERVSHHSGALGPPRSAASDVAALVCTRCGYTELYAKDPSALLGREEPN
jgi:hypothetical protein